MANGNKLFASFALTCSAAFFIGNRAYNNLIKARPVKDKADYSQSVKDQLKWLDLHCERKDSFLSSLDNTRIHLVTLTPKENTQSNLVAVILPDVFQTAEEVSVYARHYIEAGMSVVIMELRGLGGGADYGSYGYEDRLDLLTVLHRILYDNKKAKILIHGLGAGASCALLALTEHIPHAVYCVVSDSSYTTLKRYLLRALKRGYKSRIPAAIRLFLLRLVTVIRAGYDICDVSPLESVRHANTPVLFLNGDADPRVPSSSCQELYNEARCTRQISVFMGEGHLRAAESSAERYWKQVDGFAAKHNPNRL